MKFKRTKRSSWYIKWQATTVNNKLSALYDILAFLEPKFNDHNNLVCVSCSSRSQIHNFSAVFFFSGYFHSGCHYFWYSFVSHPVSMFVYHLNLNDFIHFTMSGPCNVSSISLFVVVLQFLLLLCSLRIFLQSSFRILREHYFLWSHCPDVCPASWDGSCEGFINL